MKFAIFLIKTIAIGIGQAIIGAAALFWVAGLFSFVWIAAFTMGEEYLPLKIAVVVIYWIPFALGAFVWVMVKRDEFNKQQERKSCQG